MFIQLSLPSLSTTGRYHYITPTARTASPGLQVPPPDFHACPSLANIYIPEPTRSYGGGFCDLLQGYHTTNRSKFAMKRIKVPGRVAGGSEVDATAKRRLSREARI
ncbi:hypothetical protein FRB93_009822 [Tulasnella sp. JGI-2019a]|nr:hypothetical protein FRB93_009822 [Tulasnella sp. JGI-2019a]